MILKKLIRITTVPISLEKLLENQLKFMSDYYEITAISADKERLSQFGEQQGVKTFEVALTRKITPLQDLKAVLKLYKYLKNEKPFIVHTHTPKAGIVGMLASYLAKVPNRLHTVAGMPLMEATGFKRKILNFVEKLTYRCATKVYPNSFGLQQIIIDEGFTTTNKLKVIANGSSNGIDTTYFNPKVYSESTNNNLKKSLGITKKDFVFIFVGRIVGDKGINELISAFTSLLNDNSNIKLLLVGPLETDLDPLKAQTIQQINNNPKIIPVGYQQDVRPYFAIADVLVFPSYREGFPNVVMQAGAMGLPSIVSDINGCNEIILEGKNGFIVPVKSTENLVNMMGFCCNDVNSMVKMSNFARNRMLEKYQREFVWNELLKEYQLF